VNGQNQSDNNKEMPVREQAGDQACSPGPKTDSEPAEGHFEGNDNALGEIPTAAADGALDAGEENADFNSGGESGSQSEKGRGTGKKAAPKVSPSTMVLTFVFALVFCAAAYFFPYIEAMLPWGGTTIKGGLVVEEYNYDQLIGRAHSVIVGEVGQKRDNIIQYRQTTDDLGYIIYSEVEIKVDEVLFGKPYIDEDGILVTYELGGRREFSENGRPKIVKVEYDGAAELAPGERVVLFLDDQNNIMGEKYGVYRRHSDGYYYDEHQAVYPLEDIRSDLSLRQD